MTTALPIFLAVSRSRKGRGFPGRRVIGPTESRKRRPLYAHGGQPTRILPFSPNVPDMCNLTILNLFIGILSAFRSRAFPLPPLPFRSSWRGKAKRPSGLYNLLGVHGVHPIYRFSIFFFRVPRTGIEQIIFLSSLLLSSLLYDLR
jgi:hypothetical protein